MVAAGADVKVKFDSNDLPSELPFAASAAAVADTAAAPPPPTVTPSTPEGGWEPEPVPGAADPPPVAPRLVPPEGSKAGLDVGAPEPSAPKPAGASWAPRPEVESEARAANTKPPTDETAAAGAGEADAPTAGCGAAGDAWWSDEIPLAAAAAVAAPYIAAGGPNVNAAPVSRLAKPIAGVVPAAPDANPAPSPLGVGTAGTPAGDLAGKEEEAGGGGGEVDKDAAEGGLVLDDCRAFGPVPIVAAAAAAAPAAPVEDLPATLAFKRPPTDKGDEAAEEEEDVALLNTDATAEPLLAPPPPARRGAAAAAP